MGSMNNEHEKKVSIWYVIGNADLGLGKSFDSVEVENLRNELVKASLDEKFEFFIDKTRTEDPHHRSSPFTAACQIVEKYLDGDDTSTTWDVVLVSTRQSPEHPQDTWLIGDALFNVIGSYPDHFTKASLRSRHVIVDDLSIDAFAECINADIDTNGHGDFNIFISGGGATTTAIGVVGGLLEAGVRPVILESNHQDEDDVLKFSDCKIDPRTERWLSRTRRYHLLADLVQEDDQKHALRALYSALSLDWSAFSTEVALIKAPKLKAKIRELDIPRNGAQPKEPLEAADFFLYRAALARTLNSLIAEDEMIASRYLAQYISMSIGEVGALHPEDEKVVRQNGRIAVENTKIRNALRAFEFAEDYRSIRRKHPNAGAKTLVTAMVKQSEQRLIDLVNSQIKNVTKSDLAELLYSEENRRNRNAVPKSLRPFLEQNWMGLWDAGSRTRHELHDAPEMRSLLKNIDFSFDNIEDEILESLGFPLPRRMNSELQLVLFPLGKSNVGSDDPMLEAVHDGLMGSSEVTNWNNVHFVLVTSQDTSLVGHSLQREVENWGCRSVTSVMCENPFEVGAVQQTLLSFLDHIDPIDSSAIQSVHSCFAPVTKGINLGLALSSIQFSFEAAADFTLWSVVPGETVDGRRRSRLVRSDVGVSGWQSLIPEDIVEKLLVDALEKLDFPLAESLLESSPRKWEHSRKLLEDFVVLVNGSSQQKKIKKICREYDLNHESLLINRLRLILKPITNGKTTDALKENVIRAALVVEDYVRNRDNWWRTKKRPLGYALWDWRTEAIHKPWSTIDVSKKFEVKNVFKKFTVKDFVLELGFKVEVVQDVFEKPNPLEVLRDSISKPVGAAMGVDS